VPDAKLLTNLPRNCRLTGSCNDSIQQKCLVLLNEFEIRLRITELHTPIRRRSKYELEAHSTFVDLWVSDGITHDLDNSVKYRAVVLAGDNVDNGVLRGSICPGSIFSARVSRQRRQQHLDHDRARSVFLSVHRYTSRIHTDDKRATGNIGGPSATNDGRYRAADWRIFRTDTGTVGLDRKPFRKKLSAGLMRCSASLSGGFTSTPIVP